MKYDFDSVTERRGSGSSKWDSVQTLFGSEDVLPMWVADMDFPVPPPVVEALQKRVTHPIYGYTKTPDGFTDAIVQRVKRRFGWEIDPSWIMINPGVVPAVNTGVKAFAGPDGKVVIQSPAYPPFYSSVSNQNSTAAINALKWNGSQFDIDFDDFAEKFKDPEAKTFILCNPHNPVGRVWTADELKRMGDIALSAGAVVISDEIHCDIVYSGHKHIPFASLSPEFAKNSITCMATSKTFNLAGFHASFTIIPDEKVRAKWDQARAGIMGSPGLFGLIATEAAFRHGDEWLDELLVYLEKNRDFVVDFCKERIPAIKPVRSQGTYLIWLDCRGLGLSHQELKKFLNEEAKVGLNDGKTFGESGEGFMRLNIGCPIALLKEGMERIERAVQNSKIS